MALHCILFSPIYPSKKFPVFALTSSARQTHSHAAASRFVRTPARISSVNLSVYLSVYLTIVLSSARHPATFVSKVGDQQVKHREDLCSFVDSEPRKLGGTVNFVNMQTLCPVRHNKFTNGKNRFTY